MKSEQVKEKFLEEIAKVAIVQVACDRAGISRNTAYRWRKEDRKFRLAMNDAVREGATVINDLAEATIVKNIRDGNVGASMFWLRYRNPQFGASAGMTYEAYSKMERLLDFIYDTEAAEKIENGTLLDDVEEDEE
jgi:hypothetical protein